MKIAVIGGSGFIGSHVVDQLLAEKHDVTVFDIMRPHKEDVRHIHMDLFDMHKIVVALAGDYEAIYLLAAMANVNEHPQESPRGGDGQFPGTVNVLEAVRRYGGRLIFASTVRVDAGGQGGG